MNPSHGWVTPTPPQRLPLGIPVKIAIIEKNRKRAETIGRGKKPSSTLLPFLFPSCPAFSFSFRRGLCGGERLGYVPEYTRKKNSRKRNQIFSISFSNQNKVKKAVLQFRVLPNYSLSKKYHVSDLKMYRKNPTLAWHFFPLVPALQY